MTNTQPSTERLRLESLNALNGGFRNSASTSSSRLEDINGISERLFLQNLTICPVDISELLASGRFLGEDQT
ncbi:hypothetical protein NC653_000500 [Populus alba x Populus x berolinensis]|uniref:Uncharacterized protein n=1 Tax=Populus alba x Populus x berolinensis TaxID=444605 RepID=A0AAD6WEW9_9ROSI|nr:hypothetical protein NC653_000500 [Populus alba x Populus x berolinensis]